MPPRSSVLSGRLIRGVARHGRCGAVADRVVPPLPSQGGLAAARRVIEIERVELILARRRNRQIGVIPAVRVARDLVANDGPFAITRQLAPHFAYGFDGVAWIEAQRALARQRAAAVTPEFEPEAAAFERMHPLEASHRAEPPEKANRVGDAAARVGGGATQDRADMLRRVIRVPGRAVGFLPFLVGHFG